MCGSTLVYIQVKCPKDSRSIHTVSNFIFGFSDIGIRRIHLIIERRKLLSYIFINNSDLECLQGLLKKIGITAVRVMNLGTKSGGRTINSRYIQPAKRKLNAKEPEHGAYLYNKHNHCKQWWSWWDQTIWYTKLKCDSFLFGNVIRCLNWLDVLNKILWMITGLLLSGNLGRIRNPTPSFCDWIYTVKCDEMVSSLKSAILCLWSACFRKPEELINVATHTKGRYKVQRTADFLSPSLYGGFQTFGDTWPPDHKYCLHIVTPGRNKECRTSPKENKLHTKYRTLLLTLIH